MFELTEFLTILKFEHPCFWFGFEQNGSLSQNFSQGSEKIKLVSQDDGRLLAREINNYRRVFGPGFVPNFIFFERSNRIFAIKLKIQ